MHARNTTARGSNSSDDEIRPLKVKTLHHAGVQTAKMAPGEIDDEFESLRKRREDERVLEETKRAEQFRKVQQAGIKSGLRTFLKTAGVSTEEMSLDEMNSKALEISAERSRIQAEAQKRSQAEAEGCRIESLMRNAKCPDRHVRNLEANAEGQCPKWIEFRDLLSRRILL